MTIISSMTLNGTRLNRNIIRPLNLNRGNELILRRTSGLYINKIF